MPKLPRPRAVGPLPALGGWFGEGTHSEVQDGVLHVVDESSARGSGHAFHVEWEADPEQEAVVEVRLKVVDARDLAGVCLWLSNGAHEEGIDFKPDGVWLNFADLKHDMDTTDDFHFYRVTIQGDDLTLHVDGELAIDAPDKFVHQAHSRRNQLSFGSASSTATGETWDLGHNWALREGGGSKDLGYPHSVQFADGTVVTVYYFVEPGGMQFVGCTRWRVPE